MGQTFDRADLIVTPDGGKALDKWATDSLTSGRVYVAPEGEAA
jgi:hypothetical protein